MKPDPSRAQIYTLSQIRWKDPPYLPQSGGLTLYAQGPRVMYGKKI